MFKINDYIYLCFFLYLITNKIKIKMSTNSFIQIKSEKPNQNEPTFRNGLHVISITIVSSKNIFTREDRSRCIHSINTYIWSDQR